MLSLQTSADMKRHAALAALEADHAAREARRSDRICEELQSGLQRMLDDMLAAEAADSGYSEAA